MLSLDQTDLGDRLAILMITLQVGDRSLPLAWQVEAGAANIGFAGQQVLLERVLRWLPAGAAVVLLGDRFYPSADIERWVKRFADKHHALFLGCGRHYPIALEGALKLKEISYIHAEAYLAGELKHGPPALVDAEMPVISVAPNDDLLEKLKSNLQEVEARGGELHVFADEDSHIPESGSVHILRLPEHYGELSPILHVIPL